MAFAAKHRWFVFWLVCAALLVARAGGRRESRGVILDHLEFGRRLLAGEDVHGPWRSDPKAPVRPLHAPYPPSFGLVTAPFAVLANAAGTGAARIAWALLQMACLAALALALRRRLRDEWPDATANGWHWLWLATFLLGSRFLLRDTHGGGGNLVNVALCLLAFDAAERERPARAGLLLGLSLATKPTQPWLMLVFLLFGRTRALGWTFATGIGAILLTLALQRFDFAPWQRWIAGTWAFATQPDPFATPSHGFPPFEWMNQALRCAVARWCGDVPPEFARRVVLGVPQGLGLSLDAVVWITRLSSATLLGALAAIAWRTAHRPAARPFVFAAALTASVLLSPLSWKAHHVALLPLLFLLAADARSRRGPRWLLGAWAICCLPGGDLIGDAADEWLNSVYVVTAWDVVLFAWALVRAGAAAAAAPLPSVTR